MSFAHTAVSRDVIRSYLETDYHVISNPPFTIRAKQISNELIALHAANGVSCSAFITAWNPYSELTDPATNMKRQKQLLKELTIDGLTSIPGLGKHPTTTWEGEESLLILGVDMEHAKAIGVRWGQNAILWMSADGSPQLILLK